MSFPPLTPPVDNTRDPPMHEMDWQRLERLTVDLFGYEPHISSSDDYGLSGQADHGVDVLARRVDGDGEEVASCKVRKEIEAKDLAAWSDAFLKHWDSNWSSRNIRRFVLATTATNTGDRNVQDQVTAERARFKELGITYELWGPKQFRKKLRPHRAIAATYLGEVWADTICGPAQGFGIQTGPSAALISASTVSQLSELQGKLSDQAAKRAEAALDDLRCGKLEAVHSFVEELRTPEVWNQIQAPVQARILRLAASLALRDGDVERATSFNGQAESISPAEEPRLAAHIALEREGVAAAIEALGTPESIAGKQLLASLLMMADREVDAGAIVAELVAADALDPETTRLLALHKLGQHDRKGALEAIQQAELLAPSWTAILQAGVLIRYSLALSPAVGREWFFWPNPVDAALVKEDRQSQAYLEEALLLQERWQTTASGRSEARLWRVAILTNLRNRQREAAEAAAAILSDQPDEPTAIGWCLTRHLEVDLSASREALQSRYEAGTDQMHVRVLGLMLIRGDGGLDEADYLASHLAVQSPPAAAEAERWIARLRGDAAMGPFSGSDESDLTVDTLRGAQAAGDWSQVPALLESLFSREAPEPTGMSVAQMIADAGIWELLEEHIDAILRYETSAAVRLAAFAASRNGNPAKTLSIIDQHAESFGEGLPADLRRLRADALARTGDVQAAVREIEQITAITGLAADRLFRAELMVGIGDLRGSVAAVREALREGVLTPFHALRWSQLLQEEEPELSRQLWRTAVAGDLSDRFVVAAMHQAFQLGLDNEAASLMPRVHAQAVVGTNEVRLVGLDEVKELLINNRRTAEEDEQLYLKGYIPSHLYVRGKLQAFAYLYLRPSEDVGGRLLVRLIRNGARPREIEYGRPWDDWVIHLDVSGLFEAHRLELLDHLESHPHPVRISPRLPSLLIAMQQAVHATQPTRVVAAREILQQVQNDSIATVASAPADTFVIALEREQDSERTYTVAELVSGLAALGLLTDTAVEDVRTRLNIEADLPSVPLERGSSLHFEGVALEQVASVELLSGLVSNFRLSAERADIDRLRDEVAAAEEGDRLAAILGGLRQRIADGLQSGVYVTLPIAKDEDGDEDDGANLLVQSLRDILGAAGVENGVVWLDDRLVSGYPRTGTMPLIGITEAVVALSKQGTISEAERDRKLAALRGSGAVFIPFAAAEVTGPLLEAKVVDHELVETDELRMIRRSFAAAGRLEKYLKIGEAKEGPPNRPDEIEPPRAAMRLLADTLDVVWRAPSLTELERYAYSDWLWANIRVTRQNRVIPAEDPEAAQDFFEVMQIGHCLDKAIDIGGIRDRRKEVREQFLNWMWQRVVRPKIAVDASFEERLSGYLADFYQSLLQNERATTSARGRAVLDQLILLRIQRLPDPVRVKVLDAPYFSRFVTSRRHVTVSKAKFEPARFWKAARAALLYGSARVRTIEGGRVRLRAEDGSLVLTGAVRARIQDELLRVLSSREEAVASAVTGYLEELELERDATAKLRSRAIAAPTTGQLAAVLHEARALSVSARYAEIQQRLSSRRTFDTDVLIPPTLGQLAAFLALDPAPQDFSSAVGTSLLILSGRHGKVEALRRLSGLPVSLADHLADAADADFDVLVKQARTPVALLHTAALLRKFGRDTADVVRVLEQLARTTEAYGPLFVSLLRWTYRGYYRDPAWRKASPAIRLGATWTHADRLLDIFIRTRSDPTVAKAHFDEHLPDIAGPDVLTARTMGALDLAAPDAISPAALLFHGLAYIFGPDNPNAELPADLAELLRSQLIVEVGEVVSPHVSLMMRRPDAPNALESYLDRRPVGLLEARLDPDETRETLIEGALGSLEADGGAENNAAWTQLAAFSAGGISEAQRARLAAIVANSDVWSIARATQERQFILWRIILTPLIDHDRDMVVATVGQLAANCQRAYGSQIDATGDEDRREGHAAFSELVEIAAVIASRDEPGQEGRSFVDILNRIVAEWPEAAKALRPIVDHLLATTIASRAGPLWELSLYLRTFA